MSKLTQMQEQVTQQIIDALEAGTRPWQMPWAQKGASFAPYNATTGAFYNGINILLLWLAAFERGTGEFGYATFNQAKAKGWSVKKGAKGIRICHYTTFEKEVEDEKGESETVFLPSIKWFTVFNLVDIDTGEGEQPFHARAVGEFHDDAMRYMKSTGLSYSEGGDRAFYSPLVDGIAMPGRAQFVDEMSFAATLAHEMVHSTNHKNRLDRRSWLNEAFKDKRERYAFEELVAELGAAFIGGRYGFTGEHLQHESYIGSWLNCLKNDRTWIFKAAAKASQAQAYIDETSIALATTA